MSTETLDHATEQARDAAADAAEKGQKALNEAITTAQKVITDAARNAEKALREGAETLRSQTKAYRDTAGEQFDEAQQFVLERVRERPVTAALTGFGAGLLIGLLLSNRGR